MMVEEYVSRRAVRHAILRARNSRVAELRDERMPEVLRMHPDTLVELLTDGDPDEKFTLDFEGHEFLGIPLMTDPALEPGEFAVQWPTGKVSRG